MAPTMITLFAMCSILPAPFTTRYYTIAILGWGDATYVQPSTSLFNENNAYP
jgi:hypothetical protein